MHEDWNGEIKEILLEEQAIQDRVAEIGKTLTADFRDRSPLFVCILRGAAVFHADLVRHIELPLQVDYLAVSSYGSSTKSSGQVRFTKDLEESIEGRDVILVEDIVDTGLTLRYLLDNLSNRQPASLHVCTFLSKPSRRKIEVPVDYQGFEVPDRFVVGYGLDFNQKYRNLPYVAALD